MSQNERQDQRSDAPIEETTNGELSENELGGVVGGAVGGAISQPLGTTKVTTTIAGKAVIDGVAFNYSNESYSVGEPPPT